MLKAHVSSVKFCFRRDIFHCSRERRSEVKVNLPDLRRFTVIGLAAEKYESPKNDCVGGY